MHPVDFTIARLHAGLSFAEACEVLGRSERTLRRWQSEGAPAYALALLELMGGKLDRFGWSGWSIRGGVLYSEQLRDGWRPGDIYAAWWNRQRLAQYDREKRQVVQGAGLDSCQLLDATTRNSERAAR